MTHPLLDWNKGWNPRTGLWRQERPGHCGAARKMAAVHSGPNAAMRVLVAIQANAADKIDMPAVLNGIRATQVKDGTARGGFRWYLEEKTISDDHAVFFNGMALAPVRALYQDRLDTASRETLELILKETHYYALSRARAKGIYYPNEYLGYLLCAWLGAEVLDLDPHSGELPALIDMAADYWMNNGWGWGEHLSDIYGDILIEELSLLILLARQMPAAQLDKLKTLLAELLALENRFKGGPRVPAIRSYAFAVSPCHVNYPGRVQPLPADATFERAVEAGERLDACCAPYLTASGGAWLPLAHTLCELDWHRRLAPERAAIPFHAETPHPTESRTSAPKRPFKQPGAITCCENETAFVHIENDIRAGSLSRFPLMPSMERMGAGLSWQCFPVCFWRPGGDWAYFQWETRENGMSRCHPAEDKNSGPEQKRLTDTVIPPVFGRTHALQHNGNILVLRLMPSIPAAWEYLADRLRIVNCRADAIAENRGENLSALALHYPERRMEILHLSLWNDAAPALARTSGRFLDWQVKSDRDGSGACAGAISLWAICLSGGVTETPEISIAESGPRLPRTSEERAWAVRWKWPEHEWRVVIDPLSRAPLREA